jgi:hypothetical protein
MKKYIIANIIGLFSAMLTMTLVVIINEILTIAEDVDFFTGWASAVVYIATRDYYLNEYKTLHDGEK